MKKLIALIGAVALGGAVQAAAWFDAGVESLTAGADLPSTWSTSNVTVNDGSITLDDGSASYTADSKALADNPTVSATVQFTAYDSESLPAIDSEMKGGIILVDDGESCYFYGLAADGTTNKWTNLNISGTEGTSVAVAMTLATDGTIAYTIGETTTDYYKIVLENATVSQACVNGTGTLSSLKGTYVDLISIAVPALPDGVSAVKIEDGDGNGISIVDGKISVAPGTKLVITYTAADGYILSNGTITIDSVSTETTIDTSAVKSEKAAAKIGTTLYLTLKEAVEAGGKVELLADVTLDAPITVAKDIEFVGGDYTVTGATGKKVFFVDGGATLTVTSGKIVSSNVAIMASEESDGAKVVVNGGTIESVEGAICTGKSKNMSITVTGGTLSASDNAVIASNGSSGYGPATLSITGGTFNGGIVSSGYVACGVYWPMSGSVTIEGGTFNITGGCGVLARAGSVSITGGTITTTGTVVGKVGDSRVVVPCAAVVFDQEADYPSYDAETSAISVTGGTLSSDVATVQMVGTASITVGSNVTGATAADDYKFDEDGKLVARVYVAQVTVGETTKKYESLSEAVAAADAGATVTLLADAEISSTITVNKNLTINLGGYDITATDCRAILVSAGKLTLDGEGTITSKHTEGNTSFVSASSVIRVGSNTDETELLVGANVTITSDWAYTLSYFGTQPQTITVNGTVSYTGTEQTAMSGNGTSTMAASTVNVNGTVTSTYTTAIYKPESGTLTVNGTVEGFGGIEVKAGNVVIANAGSVKATATTQSQNSNNDGTSTTGYAIAAVNNSGYKGTVTVDINGSVTGAVAYVEDAQTATENVPVVTVADTATITTVDGQKVKNGQLVYITYATVTIDEVENCDITVTENTFPIRTGAKYDVDSGIELVVTRTPDDGYQLTSDYVATETITVTGDVTITAAVEAIPETPAARIAQATYSGAFTANLTDAWSTVGGTAVAPSKECSAATFTDGAMTFTNAGNGIPVNEDIAVSDYIGTGDWTITFSGKAAAVDGGTFFGFGGATWRGLSGLNVVRTSDNKLAVLPYTGTTDGTALVESATITDMTSAFHTYTITYDATALTMTIYVDNSVSATETLSAAPTISDTYTGLQFGRAWGGATSGAVIGNGFQLKNFATWQTALSAAQVASIAAGNEYIVDTIYYSTEDLLGSKKGVDADGNEIELWDGDTLTFKANATTYKAENWTKYAIAEGVTVTFGHDGNNSQGHKNLADGTVIENSGNVVFSFWGNNSQQGYAEIGTVTINGGTFDVDMVNAKYHKVGTAINGTATLASDSTAIIELDTLSNNIDLGRYTAKGSTLKLGVDFSGYWAEACNIAGTLDVNGKMITFNDGYSGESQAYTIETLSGAGVISNNFTQIINISNVTNSEGTILYTGTIVGTYTNSTYVKLPEGYELDSNGYIVKKSTAIVSEDIGVTIPSEWATENGVTADNVDTAIDGNAQKMTYAEAYALGYEKDQLETAVFRIVEISQAADGTWSIKTDPELREGVTGVEIVTEKSTDLKTWSTTTDGNFFRAVLQKKAE